MCVCIYIYIPRSGSSPRIVPSTAFVFDSALYARELSVLTASLRDFPRSIGLKKNAGEISISTRAPRRVPLFVAVIAVVIHESCEKFEGPFIVSLFPFRYIYFSIFFHLSLSFLYLSLSLYLYLSVPLSIFLFRCLAHIHPLTYLSIYLSVYLRLSLSLS